MKFLLACALFSSVPAFAAVAEPRAVLTESEQAKLAAENLKKYTDQFTSPAGDPFPPPPPIQIYTQREYDARGFFQRADFYDFKSCLSDYRSLFDWWEGGEFGDANTNNPACFAKSVHLDPERFQLAYGRASGGGADKAAGGRWVCGLSTALRKYFGFYNEAAQGERGSFISHNIWGIGVGPVEKMHELNGWIAARYKEASGINLVKGDINVLNYYDPIQCEQAVAEEVAKLSEEEKKRKTHIPTAMKQPVKQQEFFELDATDKGFDSTEHEYWVFGYDASWQTWAGYSAISRRQRRGKKWGSSMEEFRRFVLCHAPFWVGNFVVRAPKANPSMTYHPTKGGVSLRHPLQPESATKRDPALIAKHRKEYCR